MRAALCAGIIAAVAAGLLATTGVAAPRSLSPRAGSTVSTSHPTFRWQLPATEIAGAVSISTSPAIGLSGDFATLTTVGILNGNLHSWTPTQPLFAGKYWWHLAFHKNVTGLAGAHVSYSPAIPFTVKAVIALRSLSVKAAGNGAFVFLVFTSDVRNILVSEKLSAGTRTLSTRKSRSDNLLIDNPTHDAGLLTVPGTIKPGTTLKLTVTLTIPGSGTVLTATRTVRSA